MSTRSPKSTREVEKSCFDRVTSGDSEARLHSALSSSRLPIPLLDRVNPERFLFCVSISEAGFSLAALKLPL